MEQPTQDNSLSPLGKEDLSPQHLAFINAYLGPARFNATKAAIAAGYSEATAYSQGPRLLKNVEVKAEIRRMLTEAGASPEESLYRVTKRARASLRGCFEYEEGKTPRLSLAAAFETGEIENIKSIRPGPYGMALTLHDPLAADKLLLQVFGLLREEKDEDLDDETALAEARSLLEEAGFTVIPPAAEGTAGAS